jgi:hypothetical protein
MGRWMWAVLALVGCTEGGGKATDADTDLEVGALGIPLGPEGVTWVGVGSVDMTPEIGETFDDVDGDNEFDGSLTDPDGDEPFNDLDGDGNFEPVWIGGFGYRRPALDVRADDGIDARALLIARDGSWVGFVALDLVGLSHTRIDVARAILEAEGLDASRLVITSTHNHQGPDTMGLWGDPLAGVSGFDPAYQDRVVQAIVDAVREAAGNMVRADLRIGAVNLRDRSPYFNGEAFGGRNPTRKMHGMVHDIRDPVVVSDQVLVLQATDDAGDVIGTLTSWSGHPEVRGGNNSSLSADWVGVTRRILEDRYGGLAVHLPECLGGMQSALGGDLPLVEEDGTHVHAICSVVDVANAEDAGCFGKLPGEVRTDEDGLPVPEWAPHDSWAFVVSHGWHIAEAAIAALDGGEAMDAAPIKVASTTGYVPVRNFAYNLLGPQGIFDFGLDEAITDRTVCPGAADVAIGCLPFGVMRVQIGELGMVTAPGELLPELAWGMPTEDPQWVAEAADPALRGPESRYFPQHDARCNEVDQAECLLEEAIGECDCLAIHAWPYTISPDPSHRPVLESLGTRYKAAVSMTSTYLSYIVPEPSTHHTITLLSDRDGDHYEDTVTPAWDFGTLYLEKVAELEEAW